ncbi:MAG: transporter substrate-binding domain-containing protein [Butyrivibrio sp.]|nr:transporter substrate-binding domain-containing protein [Butyrivibrio sp.]
MTSSVLFKKMRIFMPVLLALFLMLSGCGSKNEENTQYYTSLSELEHKRIGALTGSIEAIHVRDRLPEAELVLYDSTSDIREALITGKIDAYADTDVVAWTIAAENPFSTI